MPRGIPNQKLHTPGETAPLIEQDSKAIAGLSTENPTIDIEGRDVATNDMVQTAFETSGLSVNEWNALDGGQRDEMFAGAVRDFAEMARKAGPPSSDAPRTVVPRRPREQPQAVSLHGSKRTLPHVDDVDPREITAPVETSSGWIVPAIPQKIPDQFRR